MGACSSKSNGIDAQSTANKNQNQLNHFTTRASNISNGNGINPHVGFVIKTKCKDNTKVFINLFYHELVKGMCLISGSKSVDKKGKSCFIYGVIVSSSNNSENERNEVSFLLLWCC